MIEIAILYFAPAHKRPIMSETSNASTYNCVGTKLKQKQFTLNFCEYQEQIIPHSNKSIRV